MSGRASCHAGVLQNTPHPRMCARRAKWQANGSTTATRPSIAACPVSAQAIVKATAKRSAMPLSNR